LTRHGVEGDEVPKLYSGPPFACHNGCDDGYERTAVAKPMRNPRLTRVRQIAVPETINVDVPRRGIGSDLTEVLAAYGLHAEIVDSDDACRLHVSWADDERERLIAGAIHAIEAYLSDRMLPLVVQRAKGGAVLRPPAD